MSLEQIIPTSSLIIYGFIHYTAPSILVTSSTIAVNIRALGELSRNEWWPRIDWRFRVDRDGEKVRDRNKWAWAGLPTAMSACVPWSLKGLSFHSQSGSYLGLIFFPLSCVTQTLSLPWQNFYLPKCLSLAMSPREGEQVKTSGRTVICNLL